MKNEAEVYFHLGLSKVASTYFQQVIFPNLENVKYYPKHQFNKHKNLTPSDLEGKLLFSTEKDKRIVEAVKDIVSIFPNARIILFVRRHDDWLLSRYKYRIRKNGSESFSEFFDLDRNTGLWKKETLFYRDKIEEIEKLCKTPPLVLTYDLLKQSPGDFIEKVTNYMGTSLQSLIRKKQSINTSFSEKQLIVLRRWNSFYPYNQTPYRNKTSNKIHQKYRQFLLHIVAFFVGLVPGFLFRKKTLLSESDKNALHQIRQYYQEDWNFCTEYMSNH